MLIITFNTEFFPVNRPGPHLHFLGGPGNKTSHMLEDRGQLPLHDKGHSPGWYKVELLRCMMVLGLSKFCQHNFKHTILATGTIGPYLSKTEWFFSLIPRPRPAFCRLQYGKVGEGLVSFSREWCQDRKGGRKGLIERGCTGPRTAKRAKVQCTR